MVTVIASTAPFASIVAVATACTPLVVSFGAPIVTAGAAVYPVPPALTVIPVTSAPISKSCLLKKNGPSTLPTEEPAVPLRSAMFAMVIQPLSSSAY